jgi:hypothetical protein
MCNFGPKTKPQKTTHKRFTLTASLSWTNSKEESHGLLLFALQKIGPKKNKCHLPELKNLWIGGKWPHLTLIGHRSGFVICYSLVLYKHAHISLIRINVFRVISTHVIYVEQTHRLFRSRNTWNANNARPVAHKLRLALSMCEKRFCRSKVIFPSAFHLSSKIKRILS